MSSLGQLVAGVAHEINNPVNFIYGNLNHADSYTKDLLSLLTLYRQYYPSPVAEIQEQIEVIDLDFVIEDLSKLLSSMRIGAERIQQIVLSLRTFSRMDEAEVKMVSIHEGIDSTLMILQHRLKAQPDRPAIHINRHYTDLPMVECFAGQLNQVFMNILSNAIDALEEDIKCRICKAQHSKDHLPSTDSKCPSYYFNPTISIRTELIQGDRICISIADNGPGIPKDVQARLFDPFFTTKEVGKGTGLGLSISYTIITERHGGALRCVSEPGQGAEFQIEIPVRQLMVKEPALLEMA
jgi:signal transduction histidine kinase